MRPAVLVVLAMSMVACGGAKVPTHPTGSPPSPSPPPAPSSPTWTLSGTISETTPTASTPIVDASVTVVDGPNAGSSATSDANGAFQLARLAPGSFLIRTQAANYVERSGSVTLAGDHTVTIELNPVFQMLTTMRNDSVTDDIACFGSFDDFLVPRSLVEACKVDYVLNVHHDGTLNAELTWTDRRTLLSLELYRLHEGNVSGQVFESRAGRLREQMSSNLRAHTQYMVRVNNLGPYGVAPRIRTTPFNLILKHPN